MTTEVSVVVSTFQRADRLGRLVAALEDQTLASDRFEVVIVDNGTTDSTRQVLEALQERTPLQLRVLRIDENRGPVPARNRGWRATSAPWVAFTDDDCTPTPEWLESLLASATSTPDIGIVQGRTMPAREPVHVWSMTRRVEAFSGLFEGCNLLVRREALDASGGFDERFFFYGEDTSMGWSVVEHGYETAFADDAVVHHDVVRPRFRARLRERSREGNLVRVARLHPRFRDEVCWRPWAFRRENPIALLAIASVIFGLRRPLALVGALPWFAARWPPGRPSRPAVIHLGKRAVDDTVGTVAMLRASARERTLLL